MKTAELTGAALDWAVAKCEAFENGELIEAFVQYDRHNGWYETSNLKYAESGDPCVFSPSTDWSQGGPIIERERVWLQPEVGKDGTAGAWYAVSMHNTDAHGPTLLIAAMRCYVASKLGDNVETPEELK